MAVCYQQLSYDNPAQRIHIATALSLFDEPIKLSSASHSVHSGLHFNRSIAHIQNNKFHDAISDWKQRLVQVRSKKQFLFPFVELLDWVVVVVGIFLLLNQIYLNGLPPEMKSDDIKNPSTIAEMFEIMKRCRVKGESTEVDEQSHWLFMIELIIFSLTLTQVQMIFQSYIVETLF